MAVYIKTLVATVQVAETAVPLSSTKLLTPSICIRAEEDNDGAVFISDSTVTTSGLTKGIWINPGDTHSITARTTKHGIIEFLNLNLIYINASALNGVVVEYDVSETEFE